MAARSAPLTVIIESNRGILHPTPTAPPGAAIMVAGAGGGTLGPSGMLTKFF